MDMSFSSFSSESIFPSLSVMLYPGPVGDNTELQLPESSPPFMGPLFQRSRTKRFRLSTVCCEPVIDNLSHQAPVGIRVRGERACFDDSLSVKLTVPDRERPGNGCRDAKADLRSKILHK